MSRLSRYRRGSIVPQLIALIVLLTGVFSGFGLASDEGAHGVLVARAASRPADRDVAAGEPDGRDRALAVLDTVPMPGVRTFLAPNRPNPFTGSTTIEFSLASTMMVSLTVYDFWYNEVERIIDNVELPQGPHARQFVVTPTNDHPIVFSGMYFYELRAGGEIFLRRMIVTK